MGRGIARPSPPLTGAPRGSRGAGGQTRAGNFTSAASFCSHSVTGQPVDQAPEHIQSDQFPPPGEYARTEYADLPVRRLGAGWLTDGPASAVRQAVRIQRPRRSRRACSSGMTTSRGAMACCRSPHSPNNQGLWDRPMSFLWGFSSSASSWWWRRGWWSDSRRPCRLSTSVRLEPLLLAIAAATDWATGPVSHRGCRSWVLPTPAPPLGGFADELELDVDLDVDDEALPGL